MTNGLRWKIVANIALCYIIQAMTKAIGVRFYREKMTITLKIDSGKILQYFCNFSLVSDAFENNLITMTDDENSERL